MGEPLHVLIEAVGIATLHRLENACMQRASTLLEEAPVGHLVGQRVLERVLDLREESRFVEELRRLEPHESLTNSLLRLFGDRE